MVALDPIFNSLHNASQILPNFMIIETQERHTRRFDSCLSPDVPFMSALSIMRDAIDLYRQQQFVAVEVHNKSINRGLTMEFDPQSLATNFPPQQLLGNGRVLAQLPRTLFQPGIAWDYRVSLHAVTMCTCNADIPPAPFKGGVKLLDLLLREDTLAM